MSTAHTVRIDATPSHSHIMLPSVIISELLGAHNFLEEFGE
jgi:hypothetical protein